MLTTFKKRSNTVNTFYIERTKFVNLHKIINLDGIHNYRKNKVENFDKIKGDNFRNA